MDLEWFMNRVNNKTVTIESMFDDGILGMKVEAVIYEAEIKEAEYWNGYILTLNGGEIKLLFTTYRISEFEECKHILLMNREGSEVLSIILPNGDSWD